MNIARWLAAVVVAALVVPTVAAAQERGTVTGTVLDQATEQPVVGANVRIAGTSLGAVTNQSGGFLISNIQPGEYEIRAGRMGYAQGMATVTVAAGETAAVQLSLRSSAVELEGVVVSAATGQAQRRRELGTNTGHISAPDINPAQLTRFSDLLTGRTSGVTVQMGSGETGMGQRIRIRGANSLSLSNEPLVFVDGVRISNSTRAFGVGGANPNRLNDFNPNDIESIEVVKGPAASALYGTAGANGVLLITTKRGQAGRTQWNAYVESTRIEDRNTYPSNYVAYEILGSGNEPLYVEGATPGTRVFNTSAYRPCRNFAAGAGDCRQDAVSSFNTFDDSRTRPFVTGNRQRYGLNARGGSDAVQFFFSGEVEGEDGVIAYNTLDRTNLRGNVAADLRHDLNVQMTTGFTRSRHHMTNNNNSVFSPLINGLLGAPAFIDDDEGNVHAHNFGWQFTQDDLSNYVPRQDLDRFVASLRADYRPLPWLTANISSGFDFTSRHDQATVQAGSPLAGLSPAYRDGWRQSRREDVHIWTGNAGATATFGLTPSLVSTTTLNAAYDRDIRRSTQCYGVGLLPGASSCSATAEQFSVAEQFAEIITVGGAVQQQFAWEDRVFLSAGLRADDNSAFGRGTDLAFFPSLSASWVVYEEPWFPAFDALSSLRLRAAWGQSGLRPGFRDAETLLEPVAVTLSNQELTAVILDVTGNELLKPERSTELELGFDVGLVEDRVSLDFTWFDKKSRDALISRPLAGSFGLTQTVFDNLGQVQNSGTELGLYAVVLNRSDVRLGVRATNTTLRNEILEIGDVEPIIFNRGAQRHDEGYSAGAFVQLPYTYDIPEDGRPLTRDDLVYGEEEVFVGHMLPRWNRSLGLDLTLFNVVRVNTLFEGRGGHHQLDYSSVFRNATGHARGDRGGAAVWDPDASYDEQAAFLADINRETRYGYIHKADFLKWRELAVTFMPPASWAARMPTLRGASLTLAGRNLKTWTDYPGLDPEITETGSSTNFTQGEFNTQPPLRHLTARINFTF